MKLLHLVLASVPTLLIAGQVISYGRGTFPGTTGVLGPVPANAARKIMSCGQCHQGLPGQNGLHVTMDLSSHSLNPGQTVKLSVAATGGIANPQNLGGFLAEATAGSFIATQHAQIDPSGAFATHVSPASNSARSWNLGYAAPAQPGLVDLYSVVNTVDGNGLAFGDTFAFRGADAAAFEGTPVRLFVNAKGVRPFGASCVGSFENTPVLGVKEAPVVGNQNFAVELVGAAENSSAFFLIGRPLPTPLPLGLIGVTGCSAYLDVWLDIPKTTSGGRAKMGEGNATMALPLGAGMAPGARFSVQAVILDPQNGRPLPLTLTNAVEITIS